MIWTPDKKEFALIEAERWRGTPHRDRMAVIGTGIDCIHYVAEIFIAAGLIERRQLPSYRTTEGIANSANTALEDRIGEMVHVDRIELDQAAPEFGDVIVFKVGNVSGHCGFFANEYLYHALGGRCVTRSPWQHWRHKAKVALRMTQGGWK